MNQSVYGGATKAEIKVAMDMIDKLEANEAKIQLHNELTTTMNPVRKAYEAMHIPEHDIADDILIVFNHPDQPYKNIEITINDLINGGAPIDVITDQEYTYARVIKAPPISPQPLIGEKKFMTRQELMDILPTLPMNELVEFIKTYRGGHTELCCAEVMQRLIDHQTHTEHTGVKR